MLPWCPAVIRSEVPVSENPQSQRCRVLRLADNDISQTVELWMVRKISFRTDIRTDITWIKLGIGCRINFKSARFSPTVADRGSRLRDSSGGGLQ